jgi:hypothetical protein
MSTNKNDNKEIPNMDELKSGDIVVYEDQEFLVAELQEDSVVLEDEAGEQITVSLDEMTKAAETINIKNPHGNLSQMTASVLSMMKNFGNGDDAVKFFNQVQALYNKGKDHGVPSGAAGKNKSSVETHGNQDSASPGSMASKVKSFQKEDLDAIFGDEDGLSEEFKGKMSALFEAAVANRVMVAEAELNEAHDAAIAELQEEKEAQFAELTETLEEQIDSYLSYVAKEWLAENEVAVESSIRTSLSESFMNGLYELCKEHKMELPEADVNAVEALAERVEQLEADLNESYQREMDLVEAVEAYSAEQLFEEVADGLATTQVEKFRTLVEGIEYSGDEDDYKSKLEIVKEKHFSKGTAPASTLNEEVEIEEGEKEPVYEDPTMARYAKALSRTLKR